MEQLKNDNADVSFERISLLEDMKSEWEQKSLYEGFYMSTAPLDSTKVVSTQIRNNLVYIGY